MPSKLTVKARARIPLALAVLVSVAVAAPASATPPLGSWSETGAGLGTSQTGVSCASAGLCVSVGASTAIGTTKPASGPWSPQATGVATPKAVSCAPGSTLCVIVGNNGQVAVNASAGSSSSWTTSAPDANNLTSVSCPSTGFCFAVDSAGGAIFSTNSGASWSAAGAPGHTLNEVSCVSSQFCVATDAANQILTSTAPESAGSWSVAAGGLNSFTGVSCASNFTCVAVDSAGYAWASSDANAGPSTWSATQESASAINGVACSDQGMCIVADANGNVYASDNPAAPTPTWAASTPGGGAVAAVACSDQGLCAADVGGNAFVATLPAPTATTGTGSAGSQTAATLSATVNANDVALTNCYFEYGPTTSYGSTAPCSSTPSATAGAQSVSAAIGGLNAGTTYHFQVVATSAVGSSGGGDATFTTAAAIKPAVSISGTPAVGDTLTCALAVTAPVGLTVAYTWVRDTTVIAGASGSTYVVALADETHHLYCTATLSGDGGSATGQSGYVAVPAETLGTVFETTVGPASSTARGVTTSVTCSPQAVSDCVVSFALTAGRRKLGSKSTRIAPGVKTSVTVALNATGRAMLAHNHKLKATLTVTGTIVGVIKGTLKKQTITFTKNHHAPRQSSRR
ncbi:MAG: hypothetical protein ABSC56_02395 [Solirubrobacteraceae bacterium]